MGRSWKLALLGVLLLSGCALPGRAPELDTTGVPFQPFVMLRSFADGREQLGSFVVSRDAANFTWSVEFAGPTVGSEACAGVPGDMPRFELADPAGVSRRVVELPSPTLAEGTSCGEKHVEIVPRMEGPWVVRASGQGDVLGTAAAS